MRAMNIPVKKLEIEDLEQISGGSTAIASSTLLSSCKASTSSVSNKTK